MRKITLTLIFSFVFWGGFAQSIEGTWYGALMTPGGKFVLVFHISKENNEYASTMDSPAQKLAGVPMLGISFESNVLTMGGPGGVFIYKGKYKPDSNKVSGTFSQGGLALPMALTRDSANTQVRRPQDPKDFPYTREEVTITNAKAGVQLAGTLTMPRDKKAEKIVVLVTGSGPENRDEEMFDHRPFLVLSDWLTRNGIAVLRCDDRGVGSSTGDFASATTYDFADDAEAIVSYIKTRPDLKGMMVGLIGHSEGGVMVSIAASRKSNIDFVVLLAGPGVPLKQILREGTALSASESAAAMMDKVYAYIIKNPGISAADIDKGIEALVYKEAAKSADGLVLGMQPKTLSDIYKGQNYSGTWFRKYVALEPTQFISKLQCPVLAMNGSLDMVVRCDENLKAIEGALQAGGNKHFEIAPMKDLNHFFQKTTAGPIVPYEKIDETFNPVALKKVSDWINGLK